MVFNSFLWLNLTYQALYGSHIIDQPLSRQQNGKFVVAAQ